jgi:hypothetical protein
VSSATSENPERNFVKLGRLQVFGSCTSLLTSGAHGLLQHVTVFHIIYSRGGQIFGLSDLL